MQELGLRTLLGALLLGRLALQNMQEVGGLLRMGGGENRTLVILEHPQPVGEIRRHGLRAARGVTRLKDRLVRSSQTVSLAKFLIVMVGEVGLEPTTAD